MATQGKSLTLVLDMVGVTGSIPVAPTIPHRSR